MALTTPVPPVLRDLMDLQHRRLASLRDRKSVDLMMQMLRKSRDELRQRLGTMVGSPERFTGYQQRVMLAQVEDAMRMMVRRASAAVKQSVVLASDQSVLDTYQKLQAASRQFQMAEVSIPMPEVIRLVKGDSLVHRIEDERIAKYATRWGLDGVAAMEQELAQSLTMGETVDAASRRLMGKDVWIERQWQAERLVRTEFSFAYNATGRHALDAVASTDAELWVCWYEVAKGPEWAGPKRTPWPGPATPLDDRTADDSLRLHGQLRRPGEPFVDPETGETFMHPPNRPQDRATLCIVRVPKVAAGRPAA